MSATPAIWWADGDTIMDYPGVAEVANEVYYRSNLPRNAHPDLPQRPEDSYWACDWPERPVLGPDCWYDPECIGCMVQAHADAVAHPDRPAVWHDQDRNVRHGTMAEAVEFCLGELGVVLPLGARR